MKIILANVSVLKVEELFYMCVLTCVWVCVCMCVFVLFFISYICLRLKLHWQYLYSWFSNRKRYPRQQKCYSAITFAQRHILCSVISRFQISACLWSHKDFQGNENNNCFYSIRKKMEVRILKVMILKVNWAITWDANKRKNPSRP